MASLTAALQRAGEVLGAAGAPFSDLFDAALELAGHPGALEGPDQRPAVLRELTSIGKLLSEQDGRLVSLLGQRGPADEDSHSRVWIALLVLTRSLVLAADLRKQQSEGGEDAAVALLGATRLLPSSGRLALAAAVRPDSSLSADLRRKLLQRNLAAARAACELLSISGSGRLLRAATKAFDPAAATMWLQLATSGLLSLATGGPLAATLEPDDLLKLTHDHACACQLLCGKQLRAISGAVAGNSTVQQLLVRQLAEHSLPAAVVLLESAAAVGPEGASQLPMPSGQAWDFAATAMRSLMAPGLQPAAQQYVQQQLPAMLQLAQRLVAALPAACDEGSQGSLCSAWWQAALLLLFACDAMGGLAAVFEHGSEEAKLKQRAASWAAVQCLPRLAAVLPLLLQSPAFDVPLETASALFWQLFLQFDGVCCTPGTSGFFVDDSEQLCQLLAGAEAAIRIAFAQQAAVPAAGMQGDAGAAEALVELSIHALDNSAMEAKCFASSLPERQLVGAEQLGSAGQAALQLHDFACRLVHGWAATAECAGAQTLMRLQRGLQSAAVAASGLLDAAAGQEGPRMLDRRTAVLAAHWEAVQQLMLLLPRYWTDDLAWLARVSPPSFLMLHPQLLERMAAAAQDMVHHERELACLAGFSHLTMQYCCGSARAIATLLGTDIFSQTAARLSADTSSAFTVCEDQLKVLASFVHEAESAADSWDDSSLQSQLRVAVAALRRALPAPLQPPWELPTATVNTALQQLSCLADCVTKAQAVAALLRQHWDARASSPAVLSAARLDLARAAATRNCANLLCPHFGGAGRRGKKCTGCRAVRYCCQECNVAGWRAGHKHVCATLAAERQ